MAGTGCNLRAASVTIGESAAGSTGNNSVTVGGTLTASFAINVGNTNGVGVNLLTIKSTGIVNVAGARHDRRFRFPQTARARTR